MAPLGGDFSAKVAQANDRIICGASVAQLSHALEEHHRPIAVCIHLSAAGQPRRSHQGERRPLARSDADALGRAASSPGSGARRHVHRARDLPDDTAAAVAAALGRQHHRDLQQPPAAAHADDGVAARAAGPDEARRQPLQAEQARARHGVEPPGLGAHAQARRELARAHAAPQVPEDRVPRDAVRWRRVPARARAAKLTSPRAGSSTR